MQKSTGFYDYVWSPYEGCLNNCWYCYAKTDMENTGRNIRRPLFYKYRLNEPMKLKGSHRIFVTHYGDLFGCWVPQSWINQIIDVCSQSNHTFIFITKNPERYHEFKFPDNCVLGVTVESPEVWHRDEAMIGLTDRKMCSVEPILGDFAGKDFSQFELVVIGRMLFHKSDFDPDWVRSVKHHNIFYKNNVKGYA